MGLAERLNSVSPPSARSIPAASGKRSSIARDEDAYVAAALRVIDDDATRLALSRQALALDIDRLLYGDATTPLRSDVVDAMWWIYENHEAIKASGQQVWRAGDRRSTALLA